MRLNKKKGSFLKENVVSNPNIFERKTVQINEDGEMQERRCFSPDGLFSTKIFGELDTQVEYSCECKKYQGQLYEGITCENCKTVVSSKEATIDKVGWVDLGGNYLIQYIPYLFLEKIIGKDILSNIIHIPSQITVDGDFDTEAINAIREESPENKYFHIGIEGLYNKYTEVIEYYYDLLSSKKGKTNSKLNKMYEFVEVKDEVFTNKIFILPASLRPAMRTAEGLKLDELNVLYTSILKNTQTLSNTIESIPLIKELTLEILQAEYFQLSEMIIENIKSKGGLIRSQICGTRINFSARNIITPAHAGIKLDELAVPYQTFMELYKFEIINLIKRIKNISYVEAERVHFDAMLNFNEEIYSLCNKIIKEKEVGVLLNRNPSIAYGSILYLKIAEIKRDIGDLTLSVNNTFISLLAADYDGDVLNLISLKDNEMKKVFKEVFSPIALIIDPNNGEFNNSLCLERDQILGLNSLII